MLFKNCLKIENLRDKKYKDIKSYLLCVCLYGFLNLFNMNIGDGEEKIRFEMWGR